MAAAPDSQIKLIRAIGPWALTAMFINGVIGSGIFALPATVAGLIGPAAPLAYIAAALAVTMIALCFAEAGSLFREAGGPYLYARQAFGRFIGFQIGWLTYLARVTGAAANFSIFVSYLSYFWPEAEDGPLRIAIILAFAMALLAVNVRGVRCGAWLINTLTIGKLAPLLLFIAVGSFYMEAADTFSFEISSYDKFARAVLLLIFAFTGFEAAVVPAEEMIDPQRDIPRALIRAIAVIALIYVLVHIVAYSLLPQLANEQRPLAAASQAIFGAAGGALISLGALVSTLGVISGNMLQAPRLTYALAERGQLPSAFRIVHPRFRTPYVSIATYAALAAAFAISLPFAQIVALSALARLITYVATSASVLVFRRRKAFEQRFKVRGGALVPVSSLAFCLWLLSNSSAREIQVGIAVVASGALLYAIGGRRSGPD